MVSEDVPMLHEVTRAIRRLKNGRAAGADGITAEFLKGAEKRHDTLRYICDSARLFTYRCNSVRRWLL